MLVWSCWSSWLTASARKATVMLVRSKNGWRLWTNGTETSPCAWTSTAAAWRKPWASPRTPTRQWVVVFLVEGYGCRKPANSLSLSWNHLNLLPCVCVRARICSWTSSLPQLQGQRSSCGMPLMSSMKRNGSRHAERSMPQLSFHVMLSDFRKTKQIYR